VHDRLGHQRDIVYNVFFGHAPSNSRSAACSNLTRFDVPAARAIAARDRSRLEQLCRYLCRPPIAQQRLELCADGLVRYTMKKPWRDGTLCLVFDPEDLLARLCAMVPPPRWHLIRFHGVLSAHASLRSEVIAARGRGSCRLADRSHRGAQPGPRSRGTPSPLMARRLRNGRRE
jgi:hypothetical protein